MTKVSKSALQPAAADAVPRASPSALQLLDVDVLPAEFPEHPNPHLKIAVVLRSTALDVQWQSAGGQGVRGKVMRGSTSVMPAQMPYSTHWRQGGRMLLLSFSPAFLASREEVVGQSAAELQPAWSQNDALLYQLALAAFQAQQAGFATTAYLDAVAEVAMVHLQRRYGGEGQSSEVSASGDLLPLRLKAVLDFIEAHLGEDLSHARLAAIAGLSTYGFARAFSRAVGEPPHRYILRRRCNRARELLRHSDMPLADIAAALGFSSQAHLSTAFRHKTGSTPARFRAAYTQVGGSSPV